MKNDYKKVYRLECSVYWSDYWWRRGRDFTALLLLKKIWPQRPWKILDLGCGLGETSKRLKRFGEVIGVDSSKEAIKKAQTSNLKKAMVMDITNLSFPNNSFDLVTAFDVFEHLEDDQKGLEEAFRVLKKGGFLLLTVPAYSWLWSFHDESLGHKRRYTKQELEKKVKKAGFKILKSSYLISSFLFPIALFRFIQKLFRVKGQSYVILPKFLNILLAEILKLEALLLQFCNLPFGVSLILLGRKK